MHIFQNIILVNFDDICEFPENEIFIYCILTAKTEMAKLFWQRGFVNN
jgi:hypothetical protein